MGWIFFDISLFRTNGIHIQVVKIRDSINPPGVYMNHSVIFFVLWCRHVVYDDCALTFTIPGMRTWDTKKVLKPIHCLRSLYDLEDRPCKYAFEIHTASLYEKKGNRMTR